MSELYLRTEDIQSEKLAALFVSTNEDRQTIEMLKSPTPVILEGSRGTGKSFLMRVAEQELSSRFEDDKVLPVYVSFIKSSLIHSLDPDQFRNWILARLCSRIIRAFKLKGLLQPSSAAMRLIGGGNISAGIDDFPAIELVSQQYEASWRNPGSNIDASKVPGIEDFKDAIEDICNANGVKRICVMFDEAAHILLPEQQRQFFTLFRDLRSPHIACNAAVYPGVTAYGSSFQPAHDASLRQVNRDILAPDYLSNMLEIVMKQAGDGLKRSIENNRDNFNALAFAVMGNPRFLLKTISKCPTLRSTAVSEEIKRFFISEIWSEHSGLAERYAGHRKLIDWGRDFIEKSVIPETRKKNDQRSADGKSESTCYFWLHRDAPQAVKEALRVLSYSGIVQKRDDAIRGTRSGVGTRYSVILGAVTAHDANPIPATLQIARGLSVKRFTEYGANHGSFQGMDGISFHSEPNMREVIAAQLARSVDCLEISKKQKDRLKQSGIQTVGDLLNTSEKELAKKIISVGPVRARQITNAATAAMLEYLSG